VGVHPGEGRLIAQAQTAPLAQSLQQLQQKIGIHFRDPGLLLEAVTHSSFANESPSVSPRDNERLEYLGDAVLQLIAAEYLYKHHPGASEGELTQTRSAMVNTNTLAQLAEMLDLGGYLYLGKGIAKGGGRSLKSLLANAFEAVLGAVFLDAGYDAAYHYYLDLYRSLPSPVRDENFKGRLQQVAQERFGETPVYDSEGARVGNRREYTSVVFAGAEPLGTGHGASKQEAEQDAAKAALQSLLGSSKPAKPAKQTRARRSPRKPRETVAPAPEPTAQVEAEVVPLPEPRSRQFGEPIE
jgi:ribonuclease III